jgi:hypothetical protein
MCNREHMVSCSFSLRVIQGYMEGTTKTLTKLNPKFDFFCTNFRSQYSYILVPLTYVW